MVVNSAGLTYSLSVNKLVTADLACSTTSSRHLEYTASIVIANKTKNQRLCLHAVSVVIPRTLLKAALLKFWAGVAV